MYPGTGTGFRLVDEDAAEEIRAMVARGAYDRSLTTFIIDAVGDGEVKIERAVLEPADAPE